MQILILIISIAILVETSLLVFKKVRPLTSSKRKIYVDTSALIDGRIINIARTGFLDGDFIILKTVLLELQLIADSKDSEKRARARVGLDNAAELERIININVDIVDDTGGNKKVDEQLLKFAKETKGAIMTVDYNLIKVAEAEKIETLNINDLAIACRNEIATTGERLAVRILDRGSNPGQGIGHLPDGTMVVVDNAATRIGQELEVKITKVLESSSGRMAFARIVRTNKRKR